MNGLDTLGRLDHRVAVVTGAAGHLGGAICEALAERGATLALLDLRGDECRARAEALQRAHSIETLSVCVDLADEHAVRAAAEQITKRFGHVEVLVNNAAFVGTTALAGWTTPFETQSTETWRAALEVNLTSAFVLTQALLPSLQASARASIINIASIYGMVGPNHELYQGTNLGNPAAYAASKGGLIQLTRWLATTLAPKVRVNAISLGGIRRQQPDQFVQRYVASTPLRRMATEEDCKGAIAFLASDQSAYVTGHNLVIDGGWTAW